MAEKPDEQYEMRDMNPEEQDDDYDEGFDDYDETSFTDYPNFSVNTRILFDYDTGENFYWNDGEKVPLTGKVKNLSRRLTSRLSNALSKIFKFKVLKKNNPRLFKNSRLRIRQDGYKTLEYKEKNEWKVIYTRQSSEDPWVLKNEFVVNNPMESEVSIAKEKYDQSVTKQVDEIADVESPDGVPGVPEEVSDDVIRNVLYQIISDTSEALESENIDWDTPTVEPTPTETDISELQSRLQTLESVNETLKRNFEKKEQELRN